MRNTELKVVVGALLIGVSFLLMSLTQQPVAPKPGLKASVDRGKKVYDVQCLTCHQADGQGVQAMVPTLVKTRWVLGDKTALIQMVLKGSQGKIEIDGDKFHGVMAPHSELSDQDIADVLTYVRNSYGNKASAVTPAQVKTARTKTK